MNNSCRSGRIPSGGSRLTGSFEANVEYRFRIFKSFLCRKRLVDARKEIRS